MQAEEVAVSDVVAVVSGDVVRVGGALAGALAVAEPVATSVSVVDTERLARAVDDADGDDVPERLRSGVEVAVATPLVVGGDEPVPVPL